MITIRDLDRTDICGYLGNNLFIVAAAYSLAFRNKDKLVIPEFWRWKDIFEEKFFETENKNNLVKRITSEYNEPAFHYNEIPYQMDMNLNGYFQSAKYFQDVNIQKLFRPNRSLREKILKTEIPKNKITYEELFAYHRVCGVHIRRGDYISLASHHPVLSNEYYKEAFKRFPDVEYFLICSNDISWCKETFQGDKFIFSDVPQESYQGNSSAAFDLYLMSFCQHNIIANSSMSWWSATLNDNPNKRVIAPGADGSMFRWFGPALSCHNTSDLYPPNWIRI